MRHNRLNDLNALEEGRAERNANQPIHDLFRENTPKTLLLGACAHQLYLRDVAAGDEPPQTFEEFMAARSSEDVGAFLFVGQDDDETEDDTVEETVQLDGEDEDDDASFPDNAGGVADRPSGAEGALLSGVGDRAV